MQVTIFENGIVLCGKRRYDASLEKDDLSCQIRMRHAAKIILILLLRYS